MSRNVYLAILILAIAAVFTVWGIKHSLQPMAADTADEMASPAGAGSAEEVMTSVRAQIEHLHELEKNDPNNPEILIALGNLYYDAGMAEQSVEYYDRVLAMQPENIEVLIDKATMLRPLGRAEEAIQVLKKAITLSPGHEHALFNMGVIYSADLQDIPSAIKAWKQFLEANPNATHADAIRQEVERMEREIGG